MRTSGSGVSCVLGNTMTDFSVTLDLISSQHTLEQISEIVGTPIPIGSLGPPSTGHSNVAAVFRFDGGTGPELAELIKRVVNYYKNHLDGIERATSSGLDVCVSVGVFYGTANTMFGFSADDLASLASIQVPMAVSCYACNDQ
jgi:hypothetical protein